MKTIRLPIFFLIAFLCAANLSAQTNAIVASTNVVAQNAATNPVPLGSGWVARHEGFVAQAKQGGIDILFMGDSITDFWRNRGSNVWNQYYAPRHAANFGISGDRTQHVLWRMDNGELDGIKPKVVVLMIGTNNTGKERDKKTPRNTPAEAIEGVTAVVNDIREDDARGRHTTTRRQIHLLPEGGLVLDTPGMRELSLWDGEGLEQSFGDLDELAGGCRFGDCAHGAEPGCAVQAAIVAGTLGADRLAAWRKLQKEALHHERQVDVLARNEERRRWKTISKSVGKHMDAKYGPERW